MKTEMKIVFVCPVIIIMLSFSIFFKVYGLSSITKEYTGDFLYGVIQNKGFSFKVKINIQTEVNGKWRCNREYIHEINIAIIYLNNSMFNSTNFKVLFHSPRVKINGITFGYGTYEIISGFAEVKQSVNDTITLKYKPSSLDGKQIQLEYIIEYTIYNGTNPLPLEPAWHSPESILIEIEKEDFSSFYSITVFSIIILLVIVMVVSAGYYMRKRKSKQRSEPNITSKSNDKSRAYNHLKASYFKCHT
ncbi:MAG: hypothetical protein QXR45_12500 [Candidatus Bathyarchaeia archaeon]